MQTRSCDLKRRNFFANTLITSAALVFVLAKANGQVLQSAGLEFGMARGVPGLSAQRWGPSTGAEIELGGENLRVVLGADYVFIPNTGTCCGPSPQLTYDNHGLLAMIGPEFLVGGQNFHAGFVAQIGLGEYREVRHGNISGVPLAPTTWHAQAVGDLGMNLSYDISSVLRASLSARGFASLTNAQVGALRAQPILALGLSWHAHH